MAKQNTNLLINKQDIIFGKPFIVSIFQFGFITFNTHNVFKHFFYYSITLYCFLDLPP